ncbi:hypothetical protein, partial [Desulfamplus magnetovallimortis]|uniref:hypothetical protein n=1 Tax=Desulfamplus magnetovallimortis TaxID=1246637 RepID=UPI001C953CAD
TNFDHLNHDISYVNCSVSLKYTLNANRLIVSQCEKKDGHGEDIENTKSYRKKRGKSQPDSYDCTIINFCAHFTCGECQGLISVL